MGAYHLKYICKKSSNFYTIEQGLEIGKEGYVSVHVSQSGQQIDVEIEGAGVFVKRIELDR